jgi:hypothetical protein
MSLWFDKITAIWSSNLFKTQTLNMVESKNLGLALLFFFIFFVLFLRV